MTPKKPSERHFGLTFAAVFLVIAVYLFWKQKQDGSVWLLGAAGLMTVVTLLIPGALRLPNHLWFQLGQLLGRVVNPIVMAATYYLLVTPIGLFFKVAGRDVLGLRYDKEQTTYWKRRNPSENVRRQFSKPF